MIDVNHLRAVAEAAGSGSWEMYDPNEGTWPPRPLWSVANDAYHHPPVEADEPWPAFNAYLETGLKEDAVHIATFDPPTVLQLLDRLEAAESMRCLSEHDADDADAHRACGPARDNEPFREQSATRAAGRNAA
jgi:Ead/Ea22-like protein